MSVEPHTGAAAVAHEVVRRAARAYAYDFYLAALLAPRAFRADLVALAAYHGEIARIPALASEPMIGEIRLQWWRDALADARGSALTGNPVADAVLDTVLRRRLAADLLAAPLAARNLELYGDLIPDEPAFLSFLDRAFGTAFRLGAAVLDPERRDGDEAALVAAGRAYGLSRIACELPLHLSRGRLPLPPERLGGSDPRDLAPAERDLRLTEAIAALARESRLHLLRLRAARPALSRAMRTALLPVALIEPHLRALQKHGRDPLRHVVQLSLMRQVMAIWLSHHLGRV